MEWSSCTADDRVYAILKAKIAEEQGDEPYPMQLVSDDYRVFAEAWNMGIDAHLEAMTERSSVEQIGHKAHISIHPEELPTLVRRLFEIGETEDREDEDGPAFRLATDILSTLNIEDE